MGLMNGETWFFKTQNILINLLTGCYWLIRRVCNTWLSDDNDPWINIETDMMINI